MLSLRESSMVVPGETKGWGVSYPAGRKRVILSNILWVWVEISAFPGDRGGFAFESEYSILTVFGFLFGSGAGRPSSGNFLLTAGRSHRNSHSRQVMGEAVRETGFLPNRPLSSGIPDIRRDIPFPLARFHTREMTSRSRDFQRNESRYICLSTSSAIRK